MVQDVTKSYFTEQQILHQFGIARYRLRKWRQHQIGPPSFRKGAKVCYPCMPFILWMASNSDFEIDKTKPNAPTKWQPRNPIRTADKKGPGWESMVGSGEFLGTTVKGTPESPVYKRTAEGKARKAGIVKKRHERPATAGGVELNEGRIVALEASVKQLGVRMQALEKASTPEEKERTRAALMDKG
jgi:hypothetical protein